MLGKIVTRRCSRRCHEAKTPPRRCRCICTGMRHGAADRQNEPTLFNNGKEDTMSRIYKTDLDAFLGEATSPVYVAVLNRTERGKYGDWRYWYIICTAFNGDGRPLEYRVLAGQAFAYDEKSAREIGERGEALLEKIRNRIIEAGFEIRDGVIFDEPVLGEPPQ